MTSPVQFSSALSLLFAGRTPRKGGPARRGSKGPLPQPGADRVTLGGKPGGLARTLSPGQGLQLGADGAGTTVSLVEIRSGNTAALSFRGVDPVFRAALVAKMISGEAPSYGSQVAARGDLAPDSNLVLSLTKGGDPVFVAGDTRVWVANIKGGKAKVVVDAPKDVKIIPVAAPAADGQQ